MQQCIELLKIIPSKRTSRDIANIIKHTQNLQIFQNYTKSNFRQIHENCCKVMTFTEFPQNYFIFLKGDQAQSMYIILQGEIQVLDATELNAKSPIVPFNDSLYQSPNRTRLHSDHSLQSTDPNQIARLSKGQYFGQMAIMNHMPRNASIRCLTKVSLGCISNSYKSLIQNLTQTQLAEKVKFLKEISAFRNWTKISLQKLAMALTTRHLTKGKRVYSQGEPAKEIFIIKSGEIKITKSFFINNSSVDPPPPFCSRGNLLRFKRGFRKREIGIIIKTRGEIFGFEQVFSERKIRGQSALCVSIEAEILVMAEEVFHRNVHHPDTRRQIAQHKQELESWTSSRCESLEKADFLKYNWSFTPQLKLDRLPRSNVKKQLLYRENRSKSFQMKESQTRRRPAQPLPSIVRKIIGSKSVQIKPRASMKQKMSIFDTEVQQQTRKYSLNIKIPRKF